MDWTALMGAFVALCAWDGWRRHLAQNAAKSDAGEANDELRGQMAALAARLKAQENEIKTVRARASHTTAELGHLAGSRRRNKAVGA